MSNIHPIDSSKYTENLYITQNNATIYAVSSLAVSALFAIGYAFAKGALQKNYAFSAAAVCIGAAAISLYRVSGITILRDHEYKCVTVNKDENRAIFENGVGNTLVVESREVFNFQVGKVYLINRDASDNNIYELISKASGERIKAQKMIVPTRHENPPLKFKMATVSHINTETGHIMLAIKIPEDSSEEAKALGGSITGLFQVCEMSSKDEVKNYRAREILKKISLGTVYFLVQLSEKEQYFLLPLYSKNLIDGITLEVRKPKEETPFIDLSSSTTSRVFQSSAFRDDSRWDVPV